VARSVVGDRRVLTDRPPILGSEDFSYYLRERPGCFYFLGTRPPDQSWVPGCHHPRFDFNDDILPLAIEMHGEVARRFVATWMP
jgi:hippurate hydrolase